MINSPSPLYKRTVYLILGTVCMHIHLLMRMFTDIVARYIPGYNYHRYRVKCRIGDTCSRIRKSRPQVAKYYRSFTGSPCISIRRGSRNLFVANINKLYFTVTQRIQHRNNRMSAQTKNMSYAATLQIISYLFCY